MKIHPLLLLFSVLAMVTSCGSGDLSEAGALMEAASLGTGDAAAAPSPAPTPTTEPEPTAPPAPEPDATAAPTPAAQPEPTAPPAFEYYDAPGALELPLPLEAGVEPGAVIDTEELVLSGAIGRRILYHSRSAQGAPVAVSGFVAYPDGEPPDGGWPLVAWAHGTTGLGDRCAPSHDAENDQLAQALVGFGFAVVATDYEGLGTPGTHPYVVGASEAHSVLDSVRAVHELGLPVTDQWIVFGHSQGGHAALFTGQIQPTYAPELDIIGVIAGAPPSQMAELNAALIGGDFQGYLVMTAAGLAAADETLDLGDVLSAEAIGLLDVVETGCTAEIFEVYNVLDYAAVTVVDDPFSLPDWGAAVRINDTNRLPVQVPLLIIHGGVDEQIPVETSAALFDQLCAFADQGPTVRNVYPDQTHAGVLTTGAAVLDVLTWTQGRFAGEVAPDDCPT